MNDNKMIYFVNQLTNAVLNKKVSSRTSFNQMEDIFSFIIEKNDMVITITPNERKLKFVGSISISIKRGNNQRTINIINVGKLFDLICNLCEKIQERELNEQHSELLTLCIEEITSETNTKTN